MEKIDDLIAYFSEEAVKKADKGFLSERIRRFVRTYYSQYHETPAIVYALFNAYKRLCDDEVKDSYFRGVIEKAWVTFVDNDGVQRVHLDQQKKLRLRKRKV
jgi:sulfur relay (sulfurtransferase) DsrC/TusE family protein